MKSNLIKLITCFICFLYFVCFFVVTANKTESVSNDKIDPKLKIERKINDPGDNRRNKETTESGVIKETENVKKSESPESEKDYSRSDRDFDKVFDEIKGRKTGKVSFLEKYNIFIIGCIYIALGLVLLVIFIYRIKNISVVKSRKIRRKKSSN